MADGDNGAANDRGAATLEHRGEDLNFTCLWDRDNASGQRLGFHGMASYAQPLPRITPPHRPRVSRRPRRITGEASRRTHSATATEPSSPRSASPGRAHASHWRWSVATTANATAARKAKAMKP